MAKGPGELHLVRQREVRWVLVPSLAVAVVGVAAWIGTELTGGESAGGSTAWAGIGLITAVGVGLWIILSVWLRVNERRHAEAVLADAIVDWPQYSTSAQWDKDVESTVEQLWADPLQVVGPAAVFSAAVVLIAVVAAVTGDTATSLVLGAVALAVVWLLAVVIIVVRVGTSRRSQQRTRVRLASIEPFPRCWVSDAGAYFEDTGLVRFHQLSGVGVVEPGDVAAHRRELKESGPAAGIDTDLTPLDTRLSKSGWALLALTTDSTMAHTFWLKLERLLRNRAHHHEWVNVVHVRVPPDQVYRAHEIAARIRRRWLG